MSVEHNPWTREDVVLFLGAYLPSALISFLLARLVPESWAGSAGRLIASQAIVYVLSILMLVALANLRQCRTADALAWRFSWRQVPLALLAGPALAVALNIVAYLLGASNVPSEVKQWLNDPRLLPAAALMIVAFGPFVEETVFRGFFQPFVITRAGVFAGITLVSFAFALIHGPTYQWSWPHLVAMGLAGCAFGAMRQLTGSTIASAIFHSSYNFTMLYAYLKQV